MMKVRMTSEIKFLRVIITTTKNWSFLTEKCFKRGAFCFDHEKCEGKISGDTPFVICESIVKTITLVLLYVQLFNCHFVLLAIIVDIKPINRCDRR